MEPPGFWEALGRKDRKAYDCMLQGTVCTHELSDMHSHIYSQSEKLAQLRHSEELFLAETGGIIYLRLQIKLVLVASDSKYRKSLVHSSILNLEE